MNGCRCSDRRLTYLSPVRVVSRRIRGLISRQLHTPHIITDSTILNSPLLTCRVHGFMRMSPYPYTYISSIQLETRLVRPGNVFPIINSPMSVLTGPGEVYSLVSCSQQGYTSGHSAPKTHIDDVSLGGSYGDTFCWPSIKICSNLRKGARLSRLMTLDNRRLSRSCMIFFRRQQCCRFDVFLAFSIFMVHS
ncbi:uncharacterized protein TNCV_3843721 [Trichonephila clavipes]|nr:uncharacterized protein TNCV_3843721 [Trichonephila clavipes]